MKKLYILFFWVAVFSLVLVCPAFAEDAQPADEIWTKLADKASKVGVLLQRSGFYIAGIGLIFFSFMAIFNKISWKNLAYIMLSCLILSVIVGLVNYFSVRGGDQNPELEYTTFNGPNGKVEFTGGITPSGGTEPGF